LPNPRVRALRAPGPKLDVHPPQDRGERATFAHLFEESVPGGTPAARTLMSGGDGLDAALAALLRVPLTDLPAQLDGVGQELAFHLATDPTLYDRLEKAIKQRRPSRGRAVAARARGSHAVPPSNVRATRARLRASDASPTLKERLGR
jgi:serine protease